MLKKLLAVILALFAAVAFAATADANKSTEAELEAVKGIGPVTAKAIIEERDKAPFKDWKDLTTRVKGVKDKKAAALSKEGLTIDGTSYSGAAPKATETAQAASKPMTREEKKAAKKADEAASKPMGKGKKAAKNTDEAASQPAKK